MKETFIKDVIALLKSKTPKIYKKIRLYSAIIGLTLGGLTAYGEKNNWDKYIVYSLGIGTAIVAGISGGTHLTSTEQKLVNKD